MAPDEAAPVDKEQSREDRNAAIRRVRLPRPVANGEVHFVFGEVTAPYGISVGKAELTVSISPNNLQAAGTECVAEADELRSLLQARWAAREPDVKQNGLPREAAGL